MTLKIPQPPVIEEGRLKKEYCRKNLFNLQSSIFNNQSKRGKIALVQPLFEKLINPTIDPPLGLLILAQVLRREGHDVQVFSDNDFSTFDERLLDFDCVGISFTTPTAYRSYKLADQLRDRGIKTIGGGVHASALPDEALEHFDSVVIGEGESAVCEAIEMMATNPLYKGGRGISISSTRKYFGVPLASFEEPAWDLYHFSQTRTIANMPAIMIETSRGCNYRCNFCNSSVLSKTLRYKPLAQIGAEVKWLMSKGYKAFKITDDDFIADESRASQIATMFGELGVKYRIFSHIRGMNYTLARHLVDTGCVSCGLGIETCDDDLLKLMNKPQRYRDISSGLVAMQEAELPARLFLLVGYPGETDESVELTISRLSKLPWSSYACFSCIPYPGTMLFAEPARFGITYISHNWDEYAQIDKENNVSYVMDTTSFSRDDVRRRREKVIAALGISRSGIRAGQNV